MIMPSNGRIVLFTPARSEDRPVAQHDPAQPLAAIVAHVWNERLINLCAFDSHGVPLPVTSVPLVQDGDPKPEGFFAEWMPYQKGQAAKAEALEKQLAPAATAARDVSAAQASAQQGDQGSQTASSELSQAQS
ncbi:MAG: hypothetical protein HXY30_14875 [Pseudorhodoplanes sp.]|nr:hypothetical protein [Pseudorhodoplanes sp.]